ncbi:cell division protein FtsB [uncultured Oceanicoccus sp.]|uniref:cell division protein FtsB n=1 Tax=uncultured Oceanicoccus sp. TaxID=1706381 RepID=UPI0030D6D86A
MRWILMILVIILIGLQYRLWFGQGSWEQIVSLQRELDQQHLFNQRLRDRNQVVENEVRDLKSGLESVEERARTELGLIKDGETFYLLIDQEKNTQ